MTGSIGQSFINIEPIVTIVMGIDRDNPNRIRIIAIKENNKV